MIKEIIDEISKLVPEMFHFVVMYEDGVVFQTSFSEQDGYNVPSIGENLAHSIKHLQAVIKMAKLEDEKYKHIIFDSEKFVLIVFKLGEDSHMALFLHKKNDEIRIPPIQKYLEVIQDIVDVSSEKLEQASENPEQDPN